MSQGDRFSYLKKANMLWEKRIHKSLNSMCADLGIPLGKLRSSADKEEMTDKWNELSTYDLGILYKKAISLKYSYLIIL